MGHLPIHRGRSAAAFVLLAAVLDGCVMVPAQRGYGGSGGYRSAPVYAGDQDDYVAVAPPPARYEVIGVAP